MKISKKDRRVRRAVKARSHIRQLGVARLTIHRTPRHIYAQVFDASGGKVLAAASTVPVVATGFAAWQWALEGQTLKGVLFMHLVLGCISSVLIWLVYWIHRRVRRHPSAPLPPYRLPIEAVAVLLLGLTAHLGGFLSGVNGPG